MITLGRCRGAAAEIVNQVRETTSDLDYTPTRVLLRQLAER